MKSKAFINQPLEEILQRASLVSAAQVEEALREQSQQQEPKLGEIMAKKGWIKPETADFFVNHWQNIISQTEKQPLGYYLQQAGLLDQDQIDTIINEQKQGRIWVRLGACAALKGWVKQTTIDFFIEHLFPEYATDSPFTKPKPVKDILKPKKELWLKSLNHLHLTVSKS